MLLAFNNLEIQKREIKPASAIDDLDVAGIDVWPRPLPSRAKTPLGITWTFGYLYVKRHRSVFRPLTSAMKPLYSTPVVMKGVEDLEGYYPTPYALKGEV
jgi:hypothetical protein